MRSQGALLLMIYGPDPALTRSKQQAPELCRNFSVFFSESRSFKKKRFFYVTNEEL